VFRELEKRLKDLASKEIRIVASGAYPTKKATEVRDVAVYQNDGTPTIKAAKFVEKAAKANKDWKRLVFEQAMKHLGGDIAALHEIGKTVARDIGAHCWRVDTGRLRESFKYQITTERQMIK